MPGQYIITLIINVLYVTILRRSVCVFLPINIIVVVRS